MRTRPLSAFLLALATWPLPLSAQTGVSAGAAKSIEIVLDASGSMSAKLADGRSRLDGAREAIGIVAPAIPAQDRLALRVYGDQWPREKHNCEDTRLAVPFAAAGQAAPAALAAVKGVKAQGYTPITWVIEQAANDLAAEQAAEKLVILVSDGKETCKGDPCATARALVKAGAKLAIHTIGFGVDSAARLQLECIAAATGGRYFPAESAQQLAEALKTATVTSATRLAVEQSGPGKLTINGADLSGHDVIDSVTGQKVATISATGGTVTVPSGIYTVRIGHAGAWRGVEVKAGRTTVLTPGHLHVARAMLRGHDVVDPETGDVFGTVSSTKDTIAILPGTYDVMFGKVAWSGVRIDAGQHSTLNPGGLDLHGASIDGHRVATADGREAGSVSATGSMIALPPGSYTVAVGAKKVPFTVAEGQWVEIDIRSPQ